MKGITSRTKENNLTGVTNIKYRIVIEFDPPRTARSKQADGTKKISRLEVFADNENALYWLVANLGREPTANGLKSDVARAEAVILDPDSSVAWRDKNPGERD